MASEEKLDNEVLEEAWNLPSDFDLLTNYQICRVCLPKKERKIVSSPLLLRTINMKKNSTAWQSTQTTMLLATPNKKQNKNQKIIFVYKSNPFLGMLNSIKSYATTTGQVDLFVFLLFFPSR